MTDIVRQHEFGQERKKELEQECHQMQEDHQEHQQQMIEILEKVSNQVWKVENLCSESMPAIEREYHTPPVSQARIAMPVKLNNTPNLPIFFKAGTSAKYRWVNRSMFFQVEQPTQRR